MDTEKKISEIEGKVVIRCKDVFGRVHETTQKLYMFTDYTDDPPWLHITFGGLIDSGQSSGHPVIA